MGKTMGKFTAILFFTLISAVPLFASQPKVHAVLFYSPLCSHCHQVIEEMLPPIFEKYDQQFVLTLINVSSEEGAILYQSMAKWLALPEERQGVPSLLIHHQLLFGSKEIKLKLTPLIDRWLAQGGVGAPPIPGLQALNPPEKVSVKDAQALEQATRTTLKERLANDPMGHGIAIALLAVMLISLISVLIRWMRQGWAAERVSHPLWRWSYPLLTLLGTAIAAYLTYIELSGSAAACGPIGDCNAVQQSPYSKLFSIPAGVIGLVGYLLIFALWLWQHYRPSRWGWLLPGVILVGLLFSIYFTYLEPFVIGAICLWCLASATLMTLLLWLTCPPKKRKIT